MSQNPTAPDGYTEDNSEKIGGFHTLCADVGEIEGHLLIGHIRYNTKKYNKVNSLSVIIL
ncbi:hypothetical protein [Bartonella sp. AP7XZML]|uniref:phage major tropism determinant n=1 Tax=Bartonella sp. AP7XZML TaxID=3243503 RepID=UPI0035D0870F